MQGQARAATAPSVFDRVPAPGLVIVGIGSVQVGAAFATKLFDDLGPAGTVLLRVLFAALVLLAIWRPSPRAHSASELRLAALFGLSLALMNLSFYEALDRIHLGIAVTLEFVGPLGVALAGSRTRLAVGGAGPWRARARGSTWCGQGSPRVEWCCSAGSEPRTSPA